jgi:poly(3-hydroxybutyrate) depolymerase
MNRRLAAVVIAAMFTVVASRDVRSQAAQADEPLRRTITFHGGEREYFLYLPPRFDRTKTYWPLVIVHGAGQNGRVPFPNAAMARFVGELDLDAIVISPSFPNDDNNASRFPSLREGAFLDDVL